MSEQSKLYHSIFIGDKNTWDDWHIVPSTRPLVNPPEVKENYVEIPAANGDLDYTEVLTGAPVYKDRSGSWEFIVLNGYQKWSDLYNELLYFLHGREFDVILEDIPYYKYHGRLKLNEWKSEERNSKIVIDYRLQPFKMAVSTSVEDWKWDDLTFDTNTYIIFYGSFDVAGSKDRNIYNPSDNDVELSLLLTAPIEISMFGGTTRYSLSPGNNEHTGIMLSPGDNIMTFIGTGRVVVSYDRGESI